MSATGNWFRRQGEALRRVSGQYKLIVSWIGALVVFLAGVVLAQQERPTQYHKRFWEYQLDVYSAVVQRSSELAESPAADPARSEALRRLRRIYSGQLQFVGDDEVIDAVAALLRHNEKCNAANLAATSAGGCEEASFRALAFGIATAARESITRNWDVDLTDLKSSQRIAE